MRGLSYELARGRVVLRAPTAAQTNSAGVSLVVQVDDVLKTYVIREQIAREKVAGRPCLVASLKNSWTAISTSSSR